MPCVCIVIPLFFFRKVKEEEEAGVEGEVMVKEEVILKGRKRQEWEEEGIHHYVGHITIYCKLISQNFFMHICTYFLYAHVHFVIIMREEG